MPKRSHPDEAPISPLQMKTHVGIKEVNEGVNKEENMKEVYDKTLKMMMEGAKKEAERAKESSQEIKMVEEEETADPEEDSDILPGQTYLATEGTIKIAGVYEEVKEELNGKHENGDGDRTNEKETEDKKESEDKDQVEAENGQGDGEDVDLVQKTTLADVGFNLDGVKSSPAPSPMKTSPQKSPVKLQKKPLEL